MATEHKLIGDFCEWATAAINAPMYRSHQGLARPFPDDQYLTVQILYMDAAGEHLVSTEAESQTWRNWYDVTLDVYAYRREREGSTPSGEYPTLLLQRLIGQLRNATEFECFEYVKHGRIRSLKELVHSEYESRAQVELTFRTFIDTTNDQPTVVEFDPRYCWQTPA